MSIFPKQSIEKHFTSHVMPEELSFSQRVKSETNFEDLKAFGKEALEFLEINNLHANPYAVNSLVFHDLFSLFNTYYKRDFSSTEEKDSRLELIRIEQAIHHIYDFSTSQDISSYLTLVEEYCDDPRICDLILLLAKKHGTWDEEYSEFYEKWINFFIPFLHYLVKIQFDFHKIFRITSSNIQDIIKEHLSKLEDILVRRNIQSCFDKENEDLQDLHGLLLKITSLKQQIVDKNAIRDNQFYYDLGLWCFLHYLLKFGINNSEYTFLKINIFSSIYLKKIKDLISSSKFKYSALVSFEQAKLSQDCWEELLSDLCLALKQPSLDSKEVISLFELIDTLLITISKKKIESPIVYIKPNEKIRNLFVRLCELVFCNKEILSNSQPPFLGGFQSYFEYLMLILLSLTRKMFESVGTTTERYGKLCDIVNKTIYLNTEPQMFRLYFQTVYYARKSILVEASKEKKGAIVKHLNLSDKTIQDIINSTETVNLNDLIANLKQTTSLFKGNSEIQNKLTQDSISLIQAFESYLARISIIEEHSNTKEIDKFKYIGLFLLSILNLTNPKLDEIRPRYIVVFIEFLSKNCNLDKWDLLVLQDYLWNVVSKTTTEQEIMLKNYLYDLLSTFEKELPISQLKCSVLPHPAILMEDPKVRERMYETVLASFDRCEKELFILWDQMDLSGNNTYEETQITKSISVPIRKIIYFILPWMECVSKALKPKEAEPEQQKLLEILRRFNRVYSYPAFFLLAKAYERKSYDSSMDLLVHINNHTLVLGAQAICENLSNLLPILTKDVCSNQIIKEALRKYFSMIRPDESFTPILYELEQKFKPVSKSFLIFQSAINYLIKITKLLNKTTYFQTDSEISISSLKPALEVLHEFLFQIVSLMDPSNSQDMNHQIELAKYNEITSKISESITNLLKMFVKIEKAIPIIINSFGEFICKCSTLSGTAALGHIINYVSYLALNVGSPLEYKTVSLILCHAEILQLFVKEIVLTIRLQVQTDQATTKEYHIVVNNLTHIKHILTNLVQVKFRTKKDFEELDSALKTYNNGITLNQLMEKIILDILEELKSFPLMELLTLGNPLQKEILSRILMVLETCYAELYRQKASESKDLETSVDSLRVDLDRLLNKSKKVEGFDKEFGLNKLMLEEELLIDNSSKPADNATIISEAQEPNEDTDKLLRKDLENQIQDRMINIKVLQDSKSCLIDQLFLIVKRFYILHSFEEAKKIDEKRVESIRRECLNDLIKFIDNFNRKITNDKDTPKSSDIEYSEEEWTFLEIKYSKSSICNQLLTLNIYVHLFKNHITYSSNDLNLENEFFWMLYDSITLLLVEFMNQNHEEFSSNKDEFVNKYSFYENLIDLVENVTKILLLYFTNNHVKQKVPEKQSKSICKYVKLIFEVHIYLSKTVNILLFPSESLLLVELMGLLQIAFYSELKSEYSHLLEESCFLEKFVQLNTKEPWKTQTLCSVIATIDLFLEASIPHEMAIERELKSLLLEASSTQLKLTDLKNKNSIIEKEKRCMEVFISTIKSKFQIDSNIVDTQSESRYAPENLYYAFDFSQEKSSPAEKVQSFINTLSENAQKIVSLLTYSIIDNYLDNFSKLADADMNDKSIREANFKETLSIMLCLSSLAYKHKHIAICLAFQKNDFRSLVQKYSSRISFMKDVNVQSFESITFLNCLFQLKYFSINLEDLFAFIKIFMNYTGVTFVHPEDPKIVLDVSHIFINKILHWFRKDLLDRFKTEGENNSSCSEENFLALCAATRLLGFVWYQIDQAYPKVVFQNYFKGSILCLLRQILCITRKTIKQQYHLLKSGNALDYIIENQMKSYYASQLSAASLTQESIDALKCEDYKLFLGTCELKEQIKLQMKLCKMFDASKSVRVLSQNDVVKEHYITPQENKFRSEIAMDAITQSNAFENLLLSPLTKTTYMNSNMESWQQLLTKKASYLKSVASFYRRLPNQEDKKELCMMIPNLAAYLECHKSILSPYNSFYRFLPKMLVVKGISLLEDPSKVKQTRDVRLNERFDTIISQVLRNKALEKLEGQKQGDQQTEKITGELDNNLNNEAVDLSENINQDNTSRVTNSKPEEEQRIKYFFHLTLQDRNEFEILRQTGILKLKLLSERVLVAMIHSGLSKQELEVFRQKVVSEEYAQEVDSLSEFEKSMLYCHVRLFDTLNPFNYPLGFEEIQKEFSWIESNFEQYLLILNHVRGNTPFEGISSNNNEAVKISNLSITFPDQFKFCTDPLSAQTSEKSRLEDSKAKLNTNSSLLKDLYIIDEELVESLLGLFYTTDEKIITSYAPNTIRVLSNLCNAAQFEVQIIDFCMFFLYTPEHIEIVIESGKQFPYSSILNTDLYHTPTQIYQTVASNLIAFLNYRLGQADYLIYQPRVFFEKYGLNSIRDLKTTTGYMNKTSGVLSLADLIMGLIEVKEIAGNEKLSVEVENCIKNIFNKVRKFEIARVDEGKELRNIARVFSAKSCKRLLGIKNISTFLKNFPNIFRNEFKILKNIVRNRVQALNGIVEEMNTVLKKKVKESQESLKIDDLKALLDKETVFVGLGDFIASTSSLVSTWFSEKHLKSKTDEKDKRMQQFLKTLDEKLLSEKQFEDFMIHLFELSSYLSSQETLKQSKIKTLAGNIVRVCVYFYALVCIRESEKKTQPDQTQEPIEDLELPNLSRIVSNESIEKQEDLPVLTKTFSYLRTSRQFSFDVLFSDMSKKYQDIILQLAYENPDKANLKKEILIICTRLPWILDFTSKKKIFNEVIKRNLKELDPSDNPRVIIIDRKDLVKTTFFEFSNKSLKDLRKRISLKFSNEHGTDAGGLTREYLTVINREMFDPETGLFQLSANKANLQPAQTSMLIPSHLKYLQLAGITLAKAIQQECVVDVNLSQPFLKHILKRNIVLDDLEEIDSDLAKSLKWMLENSVEGIEQSFTYETEVVGQKITRELIPDGYNITVTDENKKMFVKRVCEMKMKEEIQEELEVFLKGFHLILPADFLTLFTPSELQLLIAGVPTIDVKELEQFAEYIGYTKDSEQIKWMWEILSEFSQKDLASFVFFVSGSLKIPYGGLKNRPLKYKKAGYATEKLPIAHTCSWEIEIPPYKSKEELKQKLLLAIFEGRESFMLN